MNRILAFFRSRLVLTSFLFYVFIAAIYATLTDGVLRDDAYIFFVYAQNLVHSGILAFNPNEISFGVTSISWAALLAVGTALVPNVVGVAKVLGALLGAGGAIFWAKWMCERSNLPFSFPVVAVAALLPNIGADRMVEGMESGLLCFLSGLGLYISRRRYSGWPWLTGAVLGLLVLTRPEMVLLAVIAIAFIGHTDGVKVATKSLISAILVSAWWPVWIYNEIGTLVPPTRVGKLSVFLPEHLGITFTQFSTGGILEHLSWGATAITKFAFSGISEVSFFALLVATSGVAVWMLILYRQKGRFQFALAPGIAWLFIVIYCLAFPLFQLRYFGWLTAPLAITIWYSLSLIVPPRLFRWGWISALILCLTAQPFALARRIESTKIQQIRRKVDETVAQITPPGSRIALEPIGEIGFYANRYIIDMGGITDTRIQPYVKEGYADVASTWKCLADFRADYLITYDTDEFLGRLPMEFPERFELISLVPSKPERGIRYRILKVRSQ